MVDSCSTFEFPQLEWLGSGTFYHNTCRSKDMNIFRLKWNQVAGLILEWTGSGTHLHDLWQSNEYLWNGNGPTIHLCTGSVLPGILATMIF